MGSIEAIEEHYGTVTTLICSHKNGVKEFLDTVRAGIRMVRGPIFGSAI
jgi:hypothetical protein